MKKLVLAAVVILGLFFVGCSSKADKPSSPSSSGGKNSASSKDKGGASSKDNAGKGGKKPAKSGPIDTTIREGNVDEDEDEE